MVAMRADVLFVIGDMERGGAELHLFSLMPRLSGFGIRSELFLLGRVSALTNDLEKHAIVVHKPFIQSLSEPYRMRVLRFLRLVAIAVQIFVHLIVRRPKIIHFFLPASYWIGGPPSVFFPRIYKVMSRRSLGHYLHCRPLQRTLERFLHARMDCLLGNSKAVVDDLLSEGASRKKMGLIYNGVKIPEIDPEVRRYARNSLGVSGDQLALVVVANIIPYKGHMDLIEALRIVRSSMPKSWRLILVGRDDGHWNNIEHACIKASLVEHVHFFGPRTDVDALLQGADIFVLPSHEEGFSNALLEAMASACAIIATDVGGNSEALDNGACGLLVPPKDPAALGSAINRLSWDKTRRMSLGAAARERAIKNFGIDAMVGNYVSFYRGLLAGQMTPPRA